jgi:hypothetical protein
VWFPYYSQTVTHKWIISPESGAMGNVSVDTDMIIANRRNRWRNTAAITSIQFLPNTGPNYLAGCRFGLYGIN